MDLKDFYAKAILLPDNEAIIIKYEITKNNIGRIQLSNAIRLFDSKTLIKIKKLMRAIEEYATEYYFIPIHNTKP